MADPCLSASGASRRSQYNNSITQSPMTTMRRCSMHDSLYFNYTINIKTQKIFITEFFSWTNYNSRKIFDFFVFIIALPESLDHMQSEELSYASEKYLKLIIFWFRTLARKSSFWKIPRSIIFKNQLYRTIEKLNRALFTTLRWKANACSTWSDRRHLGCERFVSTAVKIDDITHSTSIRRAREAFLVLT